MIHAGRPVRAKTKRAPCGGSARGHVPRHVSPGGAHSDTDACFIDYRFAACRATPKS